LNWKILSETPKAPPPIALVLSLVCLTVLTECQPGPLLAGHDSGNLQSILAHVLPPYVDAGLISSCRTANTLITTERVLQVVSCGRAKRYRKNRDSPLTMAVDSLGLVEPNDNVRQRSTVFENEHCLGRTRLILLGAYVCYNPSTVPSSLVTAGTLTATIIQLHTAIEGIGDEIGCIGSHSARRLWQNSRHIRRSRASASGGGCPGRDGSRCCCRLLRWCWRWATTRGGVVARTFCR
jgi:hypothetical protein